MLTVKPKYCFRPIRPKVSMPKVSISKGFGLFQQLCYNLSLHFTPGLQSAFYADLANTTCKSLLLSTVNVNVVMLLRVRRMIN